MWWIIIVTVLFCGVGGAIIGSLSEKPKKTKLEDICEIIGMIFAGLGALGLLTIVLYVIGWVWYYLGGWLVIDCSNSAFEYIANGFVSLMPIVLISGLIMICCGWNPDKDR